MKFLIHWRVKNSREEGSSVGEAVNAKRMLHLFLGNLRQRHAFLNLTPEDLSITSSEIITHLTVEVSPKLVIPA
jgi:hypothetical protein